MESYRGKDVQLKRGGLRTEGKSSEQNGQERTFRKVGENGMKGGDRM